MAEEAADHPLFFLSYAHQHPQSAQQVGKFFTELSGLVAELAGLRTGEVPGFMDKSIAGGRQWDQELLTAVGTCRVFVALLSPHYFTSEWCAMEWDAFARRNVTGASASERAMLPVIWVPWRGNPVPRTVSRVQRFSPSDDLEVAERYRKDGVRGMIFMGSDGYETLLWRLADRIVEISESHSVEHLVLDRSMLNDVFKEPSA